MMIQQVMHTVIPAQAGMIFMNIQAHLVVVVHMILQTLLLQNSAVRVKIQEHLKLLIAQTMTLNMYLKR